LAAILNAMLLPAAVTYVRQIAYLIQAPILASSIATSSDRVWDCSHSEKSLSFRNQKSGTGLQI